MIELNKLVDIARNIAVKVGRYQVEKSSQKYEISNKNKNIYDVVTQVDIDSERMIVEDIKLNFPDHDIIGEENKYEDTGSPYKWIIDPIDGTNNFIQKIPLWGISIACAYKDEPVVGIVYNPTLKDMYHAAKGHGAFRNDKAIHVSDKGRIEGSLFGTGFYYDRGDLMHNNLRAIADTLKANALGIRRLGAASIDMCFVAQGSFDAYWEHALSVWDFSAAMLIVREAGGVVVDFSKSEKKLINGSLIASNPLILDMIYDIIDINFN